MKFRSQANRAEYGFLENRRANLVRELASINCQIRAKRPARKDYAADEATADHWDFDPRFQESRAAGCLQ